MSLHRRHTIHKKCDAWQWIFFVVVCFLLGVLLCGVSFAGYVGDWNGRIDANVARWNIKVNGVSLADTAAASKIAVEFFPVENDVAVPSEKIKPGQSGYFDIVIDPEGNETSFTYSVKADIAKSKLPNGMVKYGYSVNDGAKVEFADGADRSVENTVNLPRDGIFTAADKIEVRFYWIWNDVVFDGFAEYDIVVTAAVVQYCGEKDAEGAHA